MTINQVLPSYYIPHRTAEVVGKHVDQCKNLALVLDKYVKSAVINDPRDKRGWLQDRVSKNVIDVELARSVYQRWLSMMKSLKTTRFDVSLEWRMVVGLGGETIHETDITLHHLYGIPYIPASALKGLARAYVSGEEKDYFVAAKPEAGLGPSLDVETDHQDIQRIFGTQKQAGTVLFFDALPLDGQATFAVDIMNPHYPDYYNSLNSTTIEAPANNQSPNLIFFLTVEKTSFTFALAPRDCNNSQHCDDVGLVKTWLQDALQKYGIGGKTSAGYGYFVVPPQQQDASSAPSQSETSPVPYVRPNIPSFNVGNGIGGIVVAPTDELRSIAPEARAFLRFREFPTKDVLIIIEAEEAATWMISNMRNCLFVREEARGRCTVLICQPGVSKKKKR